MTIAEERVYSLERLLRPRSVAVVGATDRDGSYGAQALISLQSIGYPGEVWGVNPGRSEVLGRPCVTSLADLPEAVDAVVVAIPAAGVPEVIEQAGALGCGGAVVFSAGFAEVAEGAGLQAQLAAAAVRHGLPVCGPNCNGIVAAHSCTALWGDALEPREPGAVALISQSGNVAVNALATRRGLRFHTVIASGNQAVLGAADYLELLAAEDGLRSVALYLEDDGGPRLCQGLAACAEAGVRVVVLKVGSSPAGARAAAAHSAALAGDQRVFRSLIEEAGGIWARDVHELLELAKALSVAGATRARDGLAIVTCSGGDSAQGADEAARRGLALPPLLPATRARLREQLPRAATVANPLDYTAMIWGDSDAVGGLVRTIGEDPDVGQVLVFYDQPAGLVGAVKESWRAVRDGIIAGAQDSPTATMVASTLPELLDDAAAWRFAQCGVPAVAGLRTGIRCAAAMRTPAGDPGRLREIAAFAQAAARTGGGDSRWLGEHDTKQLLRGAGVNVVDGRLVAGADDAALALEELGGDIALKLSAASVQHKSELGGVVLGLADPSAVRSAYTRLAQLAARHDGVVLAERMAPPGVELLIAARTDGVVPALILGLGGIWTELLDDVAVVPLPAGAHRIERALRSLRGAPVLLGGRGRAAVDLAAACELASRVGELLLERSLALIELNPAFVSADGAIVADANALELCTT
ncbi:MAG TPA: acetate--CoA ligase family protein [Solirubrobacteraceae bacterium]|nr:acetate--CoA ligase family protein [Solirubrobacteraceae bacterium]